MADIQTLDAGGQKIAVRKDLQVPMRDGVTLAADAYQSTDFPGMEEPHPALVALSLYGKELQALALTMPPQRRPHLKAIFVSGGHYDFYETTYHGGVMWFMPRAAREGRGGDSGWAFTDRIKSRMLEAYSPQEIKEKVAMRLADPDVAAWPNLVHVLNYPKHHEAWFDIVMNEVDGDWYEERNPVTLAPQIDIPVWLQIDQGRGWTIDGTIELFNRLKGPRKADHRALPADAVAPLDRGARQDVPLVRVLAQGHRQRRDGRARGLRLRRGLAGARHRRPVAAEGRGVQGPVPAAAPQTRPLSRS